MCTVPFIAQVYKYKVFRSKKTGIVDVIYVNSVMWTMGWERGKSQGVGQLLPDKGPGWMGIRHHEQEADPPIK